MEELIKENLNAWNWYTDQDKRRQVVSTVGHCHAFGSYLVHLNYSKKRLNHYNGNMAHDYISVDVYDIHSCIATVKFFLRWCGWLLDGHLNSRSSLPSSTVLYLVGKYQVTIGNSFYVIKFIRPNRQPLILTSLHEEKGDQWILVYDSEMLRSIFTIWLVSHSDFNIPTLKPASCRPLTLSL